MAGTRGHVMRLGASVLVLALTGGQAWAQDRGSDAQETDEIIVTAQNREQRLQDVPISLTVIGGEQLTENSIQTFEELYPLIPNFAVTKSPAANIIVMRGIGSSPGSPSLEQSVVMFVDGIYAGNARQFAAPFLDIQRLEFLRGPQGALVGRNTSAGAISIVSRRPSFDFEGFIDASYDFTLSGPAVDAGINVPLSDNLAIRGVVRYVDMDGWVYNRLTDRDEATRAEVIGRLSALFEEGPWSIFAKYERGDVDVDGSPVQVATILGGRGRDYTMEKSITGQEEFDDLETENGVLEVSYNVNGFTLMSITGFSSFTNTNLVDADFTEANLATADFDQQLDQVSQEFRILSPTGGFVEFVAGLYYSDSDLLEERTTGVLFAPPASTYRIYDQETQVASFYGQAAFNLTDDFRIALSGRYTDEHKEATYVRIAGANAATLRTGTTVASFGDEIDDESFDPAASIQYDISDDLMVFASYNTGFKGGGFQGAISNAAPFSFAIDPESSESYEIGLRATLPDRMGYLNLTAFDTTYEDLQVSVAIPSPDGLSAPFFTGNAGQATVRGLEVETLLRLGDQFDLRGSLAWTPDANYGDYTAGPCYLGRTPDGSQPGSCDVSDARLIFTPEFGGSVTGTYTQPLGGDLLFTGALTAIFQSESVRDFTDDPRAIQEGYFKLDARIALGPEDGRWEIAAVGRNLTDETTLGFSSAGGLSVNVFSDARLITVDQPLTVSVQASVHF